MSYIPRVPYDLRSQKTPKRRRIDVAESPPPLRDRESSMTSYNESQRAEVVNAVPTVTPNFLHDILSDGVIIRVNGHEEAIAKLKDTTHKLEDTTHKLEDTTQMHTIRIEHLNSRLTEYDSTVTKYETIQKSLSTNAAAKATHNDVNKLTERVDGHSAQLTELVTKNHERDQMLERIPNIQCSAIRINALYSQSEADIQRWKKTTEKEISDLKETTSAAEKEILDLKETTFRQATIIQEQNQMIISLRNDFDTFTTSLRNDHHTFTTSLRSDLDTLRTHNDLITKGQGDGQQQLRALSSEVAPIKNEISTHNNLITEMQRDIRESQGQQQELKAQITTIKENASIREEDIKNALQKEFTEREESLQQQIDELTNDEEYQTCLQAIAADVKRVENRVTKVEKDGARFDSSNLDQRVQALESHKNRTPRQRKGKGTSVSTISPIAPGDPHMATMSPLPLPPSGPHPQMSDSQQPTATTQHQYGSQQSYQNGPDARRVPYGQHPYITDPRQPTANNQLQYSNQQSYQNAPGVRRVLYAPLGAPYASGARGIASDAFGRELMWTPEHTQPQPNSGGPNSGGPNWDGPTFNGLPRV